ncbi:hypothetical protein Leryth_009387 [Lithospermum erythrorhizon]|nr:hypothetical protein Leryth_009387 [Lithospermum erythrorhizon]
MASILCCDIINSSIFLKSGGICLMGTSVFPLQQPRLPILDCSIRAKTVSRGVIVKGTSSYLQNGFNRNLKFNVSTNSTLKFDVPRSSNSSNSSTSKDESSGQTKVPFGYSRKDVILIGVGVTAAGYGLKSGLEFLGVNPLQAGNVVQLVLVLGLTIGWISTYIFRVSNKEMTYAQQLRDYESKVMEKRLESLTEAELQVLIEQVEEEKSRLASGEQAK